MPLTDPDIIREKIDALPAYERFVLELLVIGGDALNLTTIGNCAKKHGINDPRGRRLTGRDRIEPIFDTLVQKELCEPRYHLPRAAKAVQGVVSLDLVETDRFEPLFDLLRAEQPTDWHKDHDTRIRRDLRGFALLGRHVRVGQIVQRLMKRGHLRVAEGAFSLHDNAWLRDGDARTQVWIGILRLHLWLQTLKPAAVDMVVLSKRVSELPRVDPEQVSLLIEPMILGGYLRAASALCDRDDQQGARGWLRLITGDRVLGRADFLIAAQGEPIPGWPGLMHGVTEATSEPGGFVHHAIDHAFEPELKALRHFARTRRSTQLVTPYGRTGRSSARDITRTLISALLHWWAGDPMPQRQLDEAAMVAEAAHNAGLRWLALELSEVLGHLGHTEQGKLASELRPGFPGESLSDLFTAPAAWVAPLMALESTARSLAATRQTASGPVARGNQRLAWLVEIHRWGLAIEARQQSQKGKKWSKGRKVAMKRLFLQEKLDFMDDDDRRVCGCIERTVSRRSGYPEESFDFTDDVYAALAGHPRVFRPGVEPTPWVVKLVEPRLRLEQADGELRLSVHPKGGRFVEQGDHLLILDQTEAQRQIARTLATPVAVPLSERDRLMQVIERLAPHIALDTDEGEGADIEGDPTIRASLQRAGDRISVRLLVRPLGERGPGFAPGKGGTLVSHEERRAERDLAVEREHLEAILDQCPSLPKNDERLWLLDLEPGLFAHEELRAAGVPIRWSGQVPEVHHADDPNKLTLSVRTKGGAFSLSGHLELDELEVPVGDLMALLQASPGRLLALEDGRFIALTEALAERFRRLAELTRAEGKVLTLAPLFVPEVAPLLEGVRYRRTAAWRAQLEAADKAAALNPTPPRTFEASLRSYQHEGFVWLSRLATWGAGACLADDMGLGKTVQSLAAILARAPEGPTLIVAPTSVAPNWIEEARRFAPTLNAMMLPADDRETFIGELGPFDVLVVSYALMQRTIDALAGVRFTTVVLDEAQAIKNPKTRRHRATLQLDAGFRLALTGTPIENRLDDLWAIFAFINPGLLGRHDDFTRRFVTPILEGSAAALTTLRRMIRPFVLRRLKRDVLTDLPPRTDVRVRVTLGAEESAAYEALRGLALDELKSETANIMQIFGWITRLRQAACAQALVNPDVSGASAKLAAFERLVTDLRANGHRALVFSQFVGFLGIVAERLDAAGVPYQYLDGSTPSAARADRVRAFQAGDGDVFLISLRAGGQGINLTAADYVIHLDPWWNPAVEDQATDRAHRIGQERPVTVYRLIAQDTIEERILAMHHRKRAMADELLSGAGESASLTADELMGLIRGAALGSKP